MRTLFVKSLKISIFGFLLFSNSLLMAQAVLRGRITDIEGDTLPGANIAIEPLHLVVISDANGEFIFKNLQIGDLKIVASFAGFQTVTKNIKLNSGINNVSLSLKSSTIIADEVVVTATRVGAKSPTAFANLGNTKIRQQNNSQDIPYLLTLTPSLVATSDAGTGIGYTNFRLRGTDANRINITANGIPLNDAESHTVFWVNMPDLSSSIENIQVQRGVGSSTNGAGAFGGTVNMQTKNINREPMAEYEGMAGSFGTIKNRFTASSGLLKNHFAFDISLSKINSDGYIDRAFSNLKSFFFSGGYFSDKSALKINIFSGAEKTYQAWYGVPSGMLATNRTYNPAGEYFDEMGDKKYYSNQTDNYQQDHYQIHYTNKLNEKFELNGSLHYTYGRGYYEEYIENGKLSEHNMPNVVMGDTTISESDLIRRNGLKNNFYGAIASLTYRSNGSNLVFGAGLNRYLGDHIGTVIWANYFGKGDYPATWFGGTGDKSDFNSYIKINQSLSNKLSVYTDLQFRHINYQIGGLDEHRRNISQTHQFDFFNPKFGIYYSFSESKKIYLSYGIAHREPSRSNYADANPNQQQPKREVMGDLEVGFNYSLKNYILAINIYNMSYKDQLILTGAINEVGAAIMTNVQKSYRQGVEISGEVKVANSLHWSGNLTLSRNKIVYYKELVDNWDNTDAQVQNNIESANIAFSPSIIAGSNFDWKATPELSFGFQTIFVGKQYLDNSSNDSRSLKRYSVSNLKLSYQFKPVAFKNITLFSQINNIFDAIYETNGWVYSYYLAGERKKLDGYFPQAGAHFTLGIRAKF